MAHTNVMGLIDAMDWRLKGPCSKLSLTEYDRLFFPKSGRSIKEAKEHCNGCPVADICLQFAIDNNCEGIWAGTNYRERQKMVRVLKPKIINIVEPVLAKMAPIKPKRRKIISRSNFVVT